MVRPALTAVALTTFACSDDSLSRVFPRLVLCAGENDTACNPPFDLGTFRTGETHAASFVARNAGEGILEIQGLELLEGAVSAAELPQRIGGSSFGNVGINVLPVDGTNRARVAVLSNDPSHPRLEVELTFTGVQPLLVLCPAPPILATPAECSATSQIDFGELRAGQVVDAVVLVRNTGTATLHIAGAEVEDMSTVFGELSVQTSTGAGSLAPGAESPMVVRYQPRDGLADAMRVELIPGDAATTRATLSVLGSAPGNEPPTAVAVDYPSRATTVEVDVGQTVWLDGTGSSDPEGDPLRFAWSIAGAPAGAQAALDPTNARLTRLIPDRAGGWAVQLQVTDSLDLAGYADVTVNVRPRHELVIDARWSGPGDIDLHVFPSGGALYDASDCYFGRTGVDWGAPGQSADDATLVADHTGPDGAERLEVRRPAAGAYEVWASAFAANGGASDVTVELRRDDGATLLRSATRALDEDCESWHVATLDWPSGTVTLRVGASTLQCYGGP